MKNKILFVILAVVIGVGGFFAGMKYQQSKQFPKVGFQVRKGVKQLGVSDVKRKENSGMIRGEIISQSEESIVVKLPDGSSKIVLISKDTMINKTTKGTADDLEVGKQVAVLGEENPDKSISAANIQLDLRLRGEAGRD